MPFFIDYKEEVKRLIEESYEPADVLSKEFRYTTEGLVHNLRNILPENSVNDHIVYEVLQELGYEPKEEEPLQYYWYFKRK
ncbi:hypothetical protein [Flavobacterium beibuense]|uniref:hypothetical protein n=1 Tax=Flavobacterium beibuense TaxID=657326 RepID=UPI003A92F685